MSAEIYEPDDSMHVDLNTGNSADDDAAVFQSMFGDMPNPDNPPPTELITPVTLRNRVGTKLLTSVFSVLPTWDPVMLSPKDLTRTQFRIQVTGATTDYIMIADETGRVAATSGNAGRLYGGNAFSLDDYTGAIWIAPNPTNSAIVVVSYWAVGE